MGIEFRQFGQEDDHSIIFSYLSFHQMSKLVYPLWQRVWLPELVEDDEQVFLKHFDLLLLGVLVYFSLLTQEDSGISGSTLKLQGSS